MHKQTNKNFILTLISILVVFDLILFIFAFFEIFKLNQDIKEVILTQEKVVAMKTKWNDLKGVELKTMLKRKRSRTIPKQKNNLQPKSSKVEQIEETILTDDIDTSGWRNYNNSEFGISFKYPKPKFTPQAQHHHFFNFH